MFGTFQENVEDEEIVYGLVDQPQSFNPLYLQVYCNEIFFVLNETLTIFHATQLFYLKKVYEKWCSMEGWRNKLESLIKGPGWRPGSPWIGYITDVPDVINVERKNIYLN